MMRNSQASSLGALWSMLVEFKRDNGRSESGSAEGSAAVGGAWARPTSVGHNPAGARSTAVREMILRDGGSRNFGAIGRQETAVPVEIGARGISQTSQRELQRRCIRQRLSLIHI